MNFFFSKNYIHLNKKCHRRRRHRYRPFSKTVGDVTEPVYFPITDNNRDSERRSEFLRAIITKYAHPTILSRDIIEPIVMKYNTIFRDVMAITFESNKKLEFTKVMNKFIKDVALISLKRQALSILSTKTGFLSKLTRAKVDQDRIKFMQELLQSSSSITWQTIVQRINHDSKLKFTEGSTKIASMKQLFDKMKQDIQEDMKEQFLTAFINVINDYNIKHAKQVKELKRRF